jgi:hypothetical protein
MVIDTKQIGHTSENIFLSILNSKGVFATSFDTVAFDGIIFDHQHIFFHGGRSPYYVQIKCRGSRTDKFNPQGHSIQTIGRIKELASELGISEQSVFFVVGFYKNNDIRSISFFAIPLTSINQFKNGDQYRFSVRRCLEAMNKDSHIFSL